MSRKDVPSLLQELQINVLQQTHLLQQGDKGGLLHQLQAKQQELTAQLQLAQHALTINILMQSQTEDRRDRHRSDTYSSDGSLKENQSEHLHTSPPSRTNGNRSSSDENTPVKGEEEEERGSLLYLKQQCQWPGCGRDCRSPASWRIHMDAEHRLSERSTAQARVQMQIITQLEAQLRREKEVLAAMMKHLHPDTEEDRDSPEAKRMKTESPVSEAFPRLSVSELIKNQHLSLPQYTNPLTHLMNLSPSTPSLSPLAALSSSSPIGLPATPTSAHLRHSLSEKSPFSPNQFPENQRRRVTHHDRGNPNLDPEEDLAKNREFYRVQDVRPPYTYAALIRAVRYIISTNTGKQDTRAGSSHAKLYCFDACGD